MKKLLFLLSLVLGWIACSPSAKPIDYGVDKCDFCRMTVVDPQFAAELVSRKGRVYKFDAIECMVQFQLADPDGDFALHLVNDYLREAKLIEAGKCTFLISPELPSPMGANLSAYSSVEAARTMQADKGGQLYSWNELLTHPDLQIR